jgi:hypothetical protein
MNRALNGESTKYYYYRMRAWVIDSMARLGSVVLAVESSAEPGCFIHESATAPADEIDAETESGKHDF